MEAGSFILILVGWVHYRGIELSTSCRVGLVPVQLNNSGQKHSRGRGACRKFGISSWEATSFVRKAVQVNWRAIEAREDAQVAIHIERPRGFAAPSFIAILIDCQSLYKPKLTANGNGDAIRCGQPRRA